MINIQANISGYHGSYTRGVNTLQLQVSPTHTDTLKRP